MKQKSLLLLLALPLVLCCNRQPKPLKYEYVPRDSSAIGKPDGTTSAASWEDEPAVVIPEDMLPGNDELTEEDINRIVSGRE